MNRATDTPAHPGRPGMNADVPGWVVAAFLALVLFALAGAYLTGQADRCARLAADGVVPQSCQAQGGSQW